MSEKDERVGAFYDRMNRGDFDGAVECLHRDVEVRPALGGVMDIGATTTAMETEIVITQLYTFRDGLILRIDGFRSRAEAREAAGLSE
jgi:ketosteroid isomerase-like protein